MEIEPDYGPDFWAWCRGVIIKLQMYRMRYMQIRESVIIGAEKK